MMVLNEVISVMGADALASSHPLSSNEDDVETPDDIKQVFDSITYSKVRRCPPPRPPVSAGSRRRAHVLVFA